MNRKYAALLVLAMSWSASVTYADGPGIEDVVRAPRDYAGSTVQFAGVNLSGTITNYDVGGVRKYYLTVGNRARNFDVGFFLAPPGLADKLRDKMNRGTNYRVNFTCKVERIVINGVSQWHGIVSRVDFLDGNGRVKSTVKEGKK
jgi:hypothetical protein